LVDGLIVLRHERSKGRGFENAFDESLQRSRLSEKQVLRFVAEYLERSLQSQDRLDQQVAGVLGVSDAPMQHFEYFVRGVQNGTQVPLFNLEHCLSFAFDIAKNAFGLEFARVAGTSAHVICVEVLQQGRPCGKINFDLWDQLHAPKPANTTVGM